MDNCSDGLVSLDFKPCKVVVRGDRNCFVWPISDETKDKIRKLIGDDDLKFKFNSTLEQIPPYFCADCGTEITFFDTVRVAIEGGSHGKDFIAKALQQEELEGQGVLHNITCENGHKQPVLMGWPYATFIWTFDIEDC